MHIASLLIAAAALGAGSADARPSRAERGAAELAKALQGYVAGKPESCLSLSNIAGQQIIDGTAIVYRTRGGKLYVNRPQGAELLREDNILISTPFGSQACRLDIVRQRDQSGHSEGGSVSLNDFEVYAKAPAH